MGNAHKNKPVSKKDAVDQEKLARASRQIAKGFWVPAADIYLGFLSRDPAHVESLLGMATISQQTKDYRTGLGFADKAIEHDPNCAEAYARRGYLYNMLGQHDQAMADYSHALFLDPKNENAWSYIGENYGARGQFEQLETFSRNMLAKNPDNEFALYMLGTALLSTNRVAESVGPFRRAAQLNPKVVQIHYNLGNACFYLGYLDDAEAAYRAALKLQPKMIEAKENLIITLVRLRKSEQAAALVPELMRETPNPRRALELLSHAYRDNNDYRRALETGEELLRRYPVALYMENCLIDAQTSKNNAAMTKYYDMLRKCTEWTAQSGPLLYNLARYRNDWSVAEETWPMMRDFIERMATGEVYGRNLAGLNILSEPDATPEIIKLAHVVSATEVRKNRPVNWTPDHSNAFLLSPRIRVGILSGDFYSHVVSHFINGWVKYHDKSRFELFCYANTPENRRDAVTDAYKVSVSHFTFIDKMPIGAIVQKMQDDGIHILVDLTGYTEGNLLEVVVYQPAPVIITWLGYPATTGCTEVDYVIGDRWLETPDHERAFVEKMLSLEDSAYAVGDFHNCPVIIEAPALKKGYVTFGSLMNPYKMNPEVLAAWAEIVKRVPGSRLMLNHPTLDKTLPQAENLIAEFERQGFPMDRLDITHKTHPSGSHMSYYHEFDLSLDTFPQTGGTTTLEALMMCVPVVTKVGRIFQGRLSYSILHNCGIDDVDALTATTVEDYIDKAVALAGDLEKLQAVRTELSARIRSSNLFSPRKLTQQLEAAFLRAWDQKFPDHPLNQQLSLDLPGENAAEKLRRLELRFGGHRVAFLVRDSEHDVFNYVLQEQQGWFDPEYRFVADLPEPGEIGIDCCDDPGLYSLPIAKRIGSTGTLTLYSRSAENQLLVKLMAPDTVTVALFDPQKDPFAGVGDLDFLRVTSEYNDDEFGGLIAKHIDRIASLAPIVFFSAKQANEFDLSMIESLEKAGFTIYRYLPDLAALVPFNRKTDADAYLVNLFAVKGRKATWLEAQGKLIRQDDKAAYQPDMLATPFLDWAASQPYAKSFVDGWRSLWQTQSATAFEVYRAMLDAWAASKQTDRPVGERYAAVKTALSFLPPLLVSNIEDLALLLTAARIFFDAGYREAAVLHLSELKKRFDQGEADIDWPFLPPDAQWDAVDPENREAEWIFAATIETLELKRAFSSFFIGEEQIEVLQMVQSMGFPRPQVVRTIELLRQRFL